MRRDRRPRPIAMPPAPSPTTSRPTAVAAPVGTVDPSVFGIVFGGDVLGDTVVGDTEVDAPLVVVPSVVVVTFDVVVVLRTTVVLVAAVVVVWHCGLCGCL